MSEATVKDYEANAKAQYALTQALNDDGLSCVINCKFAYEVWNDLVIKWFDYNNKSRGPR